MPGLSQASLACAPPLESYPWPWGVSRTLQVCWQTQNRVTSFLVLVLGFGAIPNQWWSDPTPGSMLRQCSPGSTQGMS